MSIAEVVHTLLKGLRGVVKGEVKGCCYPSLCRQRLSGHIELSSSPYSAVRLLSGFTFLNLTFLICNMGIIHTSNDIRHVNI